MILVDDTYIRVSYNNKIEELYYYQYQYKLNANVYVNEILRDEIYLYTEQEVDEGEKYFISMFLNGNQVEDYLKYKEKIKNILELECYKGKELVLYVYLTPDTELNNKYYKGYFFDICEESDKVEVDEIGKNIKVVKDHLSIVYYGNKNTEEVFDNEYNRVLNNSKE